MAEWVEEYNREFKPEIADIEYYVGCGFWNEICRFIETTYSISPAIEYSRCSGAPGWNVKYKKGSRALCTLYPNKRYFTCLISIGRKEAPEAEMMLGAFSVYLQDLYKKTSVFNGSRWLMIDVTEEKILEDVKTLLCLRIHPPK